MPFGNWIDLVLLIFLAFYVFEGYERGFLALLGEMISLVASFLLALHFYPQLSSLLIANFTLSRNFANPLAFVVLGLVAEIIITTLIISIYSKLPRDLFRSSLNKILGLAPALIDGLILAAFFLTIFVSLPFSPSLKSDILASKIGSSLVARTRELEKTLDQIFGGAASDTLNFLTITPGSNQNINLHFRTTDITVDESSENTMFTLLNQERASRDLSPLRLDLRLRQLARDHSKDMFAWGYFSHIDHQGNDPFQRMHKAGIYFETAGENLAYAGSVQIAHDGLMNSPDHRANLLNPDFSHIGIGVIDGGIYGKMFTQEFTN